MSKQGDDCYFYFYSTCNKGDSCSFRHCEAALGNERVCRLWREGRCFGTTCRFRHMEVEKKRSEIPCHWENQAVGCQKSNCAFRHTKGRYVDGRFFPPSKTTLPSPPESAEDAVKMAQASLQQNKLSVQSNPSPPLRGVMKAENSEKVPSPTHPPVVINAADDDEDGYFLLPEDQLSEEGGETKTAVQQPATEAPSGSRIISTRKCSANTKQEDNLNFGIKTLEEIKLEKLKEKTKNQGEGPSGVSVPPLQSRAVPVPEKEIVRTVVRTVTLSTKQGEEPVIQLNLGETMGKRKASIAGKSVLPLKRNLADRLGKKTEVLDSADKAAKRGTVQVPRSLKERLGLPSEQTSTETDKNWLLKKAAKPAGEIHVKTVEEIRLERAHRRRGEPQGKPQTEGRCKTEDPSSGARLSPAVRVKTFSGSLAEKNHKRLEGEKRKPEEFPTETKVERKPKKQSILAPSVLSQVRPAEPAGKAKPAGEVRVKTLEEIKREKALRMQQSGGKVPAPPAQPEPAPTGRRLLRITKLIAPGREEKKIVELSKPFPKAVSAPAESATNSKVQVKSLEEIMWEKRQLKQRQEEKLQKEAAAVPSPVEQAIKDKSRASGSPESSVVSGSAYQLPKRILVKSPGDGVESPGKGAAVSPGKRAAQLQEWKAETKWKVCLKPLDGKATFPTKQPLKRKAAESHPSAVAAVKPLSATGGDGKEPSAKKAAAIVPALPEDSLLSVRGREEPQASPVLHLGSQADSVAQSEVTSSTSPSSQVAVKKRRLSFSGAWEAPFSVEDDFEKFLWEISGGKQEDEVDVDPENEEDDFFMEIGELIDG
ncbi:zinc finger CCCH domain-containing protein 11A-like [Harpia harpyja]|uniref:zinc finger CCCH domain-containing protein 11A-like n=1 Tax=Harpia harpyja TaxID=202280 RepID=UPI0022B0A61E|nr:zinc finger CCCH domain-containing protein 11A-like [Harpia harpyja]XP_052671924.1 zinc finger CCCH domain-containing protein 11A-like [Harpia harpyja]